LHANAENAELREMDADIREDSQKPAEDTDYLMLRWHGFRHTNKRCTRSEGRQMQFTIQREALFEALQLVAG